MRSTRGEDLFQFPTTLEEVGQATNLRLDDVAFALVQSGLAVWRRRVPLEGNGEEEEEEEEVEELVIRFELVEEVAKKVRVRKAYLELQHVLI